MAALRDVVVIKKCANRRLYNTGTGTYITPEDIAGMVRQGDNVIIYDASTGEEITRSILTLITPSMTEH